MKKHILYNYCTKSTQQKQQEKRKLFSNVVEKKMNS